eukprot:1373798-Karenia_brevis.AAC.1
MCKFCHNKSSRPRDIPDELDAGVIASIGLTDAHDSGDERQCGSTETIRSVWFRGIQRTYTYCANAFNPYRGDP